MKRFLYLVGLFLAACTSFSSLFAADGQAPNRTRIERLTKLCKVWGTIRYLHPFLAHKDIDWDAALIKALAKVNAAKDDKDYVAAVQSMLDTLDDRATRVVPKSPNDHQATVEAGKAEKDRPLFTWIDNQVLAVHLDHGPALNKLFDYKAMNSLVAAVTKAEKVIFDLRGEDEIGMRGFLFGQLSNYLPSRGVRGPAQRYLIHSGYRPQRGSTSGGYFSASQTELPEAFPAATGGKGKRTVFLVDELTKLPPIALALQEAGESFLIAQGNITDAVVASWQPIDLADGFEAHIRTSELVGADGTGQLRTDAQIPARADAGLKGPAFQKALELLRTPPKAKQQATVTAKAGPLLSAWRPDKRYEKMVYPALEYRLLALFRFWNVIHFFYPYKDLLDDDWNAVLPRFIPKFEAANNAREYVFAIAEMAARIQDTHTNVVGSQELAQFFGVAPPPIALRLIEGQPTVTEILDRDAVKGSGVGIGDVILRIDGEPVEKELERRGKYTAASNPGALAMVVLRRLLNGPDGSTLKLTVRDSGDATKEITLPRNMKYAALRPRRTGQVFKLLDRDIGYVDLERLTIGEVDPMLERLKDTRAIVFDLRGYPQGTAWSLAPRLNTKGARYGAAFQRALVSGQATSEEFEGRFAFLQPLPTTNKWKYKGKTVTLIDERAISQSEHTGLFLEAACDTTFIGSTTAGTNGDVTQLVLPGNIAVMFTGHDVRHADGRRLQRVGLVPHIGVKPTLAGIRQGKDEVLERALKYVRESK